MWWFVDDVPCFSLFQLTFFRLFSFRVYYPWDEGWEDGSWYLKKMGIPFWFGLILRFPDVFGGAVPIMSSYLLKRSFFCYPIFIQWLGPWGVEVRGAFFRSFDHGIFESPWYPQNAIILPCHHSKYQSRARAVGGSPFTRCLFFFLQTKMSLSSHTKNSPGTEASGWEWMTFRWQFQGLVVETWWVTPSMFGSPQLFTASACFFFPQGDDYICQRMEGNFRIEQKELGKECFCRTVLFF